MVSSFNPISDDFRSDLQAISELIDVVQVSGNTAKSRVASVNSSTLLLAATFEEFIREMGRQYAREIVERATSVDQLPRKLAATAWKRTLEGLARAKLDTGGTPESFDVIARDAKQSFDKVCGFVGGDISQDIYQALIHNEYNMRPKQLNEIFNVCDLSNVCRKFSDKQPLLDFFDETEAGKVHGQFLVWLNDFMERRNSIAHSLNPGNSLGPERLLKDIDFLDATALALSETLSASLATTAPTIEEIPAIENLSEQPVKSTILQRLKMLFSFQ